MQREQESRTCVVGEGDHEVPDDKKKVGDAVLQKRALEWDERRKRGTHDRITSVELAQRAQHERSKAQSEHEERQA